MRRLKALMVLGVLWGIVPQYGAAAEMPKVELTAGVHLIEAEVAHTNEARMLGLMHRKTLPGNQGMVFVFPEDEHHCMWMKNTYVPLSAAFIDRDGRIINIADMVPQTSVIHCAQQPARYVLEMPQGWFDKRGVKPGARLAGLEKLPAPK